MSKEKSTLGYLSNIQWIDITKENDISYMRYVHDPFSLEKMISKRREGKINYYPSSLQGKEFKHVAGHCAYAFKNDYPWGTVSDREGQSVVCKCINTECPHFGECRGEKSPFDKKELLLKDIGERPDDSGVKRLAFCMDAGKLFKKKLVGEIDEAEKNEDNAISVGKAFDGGTRDTSDVTQKNQNGEIEFRKWLKNDGFLAKVIEKYISYLKPYGNYLTDDKYKTIFDVEDIRDIEKIEGLKSVIESTAQDRAAFKYLKKFVESRFQKEFEDNSSKIVSIDVKPESKEKKCTENIVKTPEPAAIMSEGEQEFRRWLKNDGFYETVIDNYIIILQPLGKYMKSDMYETIFDIDDIKYLEALEKRITESISSAQAKAALKYLKKFINSRIPVQNSENVKNRLDESQSIESQKCEMTFEDEILDEFYSWLCDASYSDMTARGYINAVQSSSKYARKKAIWSIDVYDQKVIFAGNAEVVRLISQLENSPYFNVKLSNYIVALKLFADFVKTKESEGINETDNNDEQKDENNKSEKILFNPASTNLIGFDDFIIAEQETVIKSGYNEKIVVNAGPGTGKTYTLIEKLIYMVNEENVDPEEILVLCFSRAAVDVIEHRLRRAAEDGRIGMNWHSIDIRTFDSFATHLLAYVATYESNLVDNDFSLEKLDYDARIKAATALVRKEKALIEQCTHLIVDEVQDLVTTRAEFVMKIIDALPYESGYTILGDACQSIYDYQCSEGEIDSVKFYRWLFLKHSESKFYSFTVNYRQTSVLENLGNSYRKEILTGDDLSRKKAVTEIVDNIETLDNIDLKSTSLKEIRELVGTGSVGILTRTNGQALKISTWFRNSGIPHTVQRRLGDYSLNIWIAEMFMNYENETIDKAAFIKAFVQKGGYGLDADEVWNAIEKTQREYCSRYTVEAVMEGIINDGKDKLFYTSTDSDKIVISNIHRAKGREYDNVILLDDDMITNGDTDKDINEHKVTYVALTRAKSKLYRSALERQYIKTDKEGERRAYATGLNHRKKKPYLSHIEIGRNNDLDQSSFAERKEIQILFEDPIMLVGERVILKKNSADSQERNYISYDIFLEDNIGIGRLGRTSRRFYLDMKRILKTIYGISPYSEVYPNIYPDRISDIYVDDVISVIKRFETDDVFARRFGKYAVMRGITLVGMGHIERDSY